MSAGGLNKLPYGNLPRLILAWVSTEAVRTQSRELVLGKSLSEFMRTLGIYNSGGNPQTRLRNQMKRLFGCTVSMIYEDKLGFARVSSFGSGQARVLVERAQTPVSGCCLTAKFGWVKTSSTRSSTVRCRST